MYIYKRSSAKCQQSEWQKKLNLSTKLMSYIFLFLCYRYLLFDLNNTRGRQLANTALKYQGIDS